MTDILIVCEGWATAATLYEEAGHSVVAAMNAGNLAEVCQALAKRLPPSVQIIVAADNDHRTESNPGMAKAKHAASLIGAGLIAPPVPCTHPDCKCTDFNDYQNCSKRFSNE